MFQVKEDQISELEIF